MIDQKMLKKMLKITDIVKDEILEIIFLDKQIHSKNYTIKCENGHEFMQGKITGFTQRTCLYIGELKKGKYQFQIEKQDTHFFEKI